MKKSYPITTDNVKNVGGKDIILKRMVNHYIALSSAKPKIDIKPPPEHVSKTRTNLKNDIDYKIDYHNVRETYKAVSIAKPQIDNKLPYTFNKRTKGKYDSCKEKYANSEHVRVLEAMSKRILSIGKPHERKKNINDPIANPTFFFKRPEDQAATKLLSLNTFNDKLKELNDKEHNKLLLGKTIYKSLGVKPPNEELRPQSALISKYEQKKPKKILPVDIDPNKYLKIHTINRGCDGKTIMKQCRDEEEKSRSDMNKSKSKRIRSIQNDMNLPLYEENEVDGEKEFQTKVVQMVIEYKVFAESDFKLLGDNLKRVNCPERLSEERLEKIMRHIKTILDG